MSKEAVIVPKLTLVEWEMQTRKVSKETLLKEWSVEGVDIDRALASHLRQKETNTQLSDILQVQQVHRDNWNHETASKYSEVVAPGGDNHFQYVARFILGEQVLIGLNNDPHASYGGMLPFGPEDVNLIARYLKDRDYKTKFWTRLSATLNGERLPYYALSEIFIGEVKSRGMNRNVITYRGIVEEQKNSGFIIATGSGLTGWYSSIVGHWKEELTRPYPPFKRHDPKARFVSRERALDRGGIDIADLELGEALQIQSLNKNGEISFDPDPSDDRFSFPFKRGAKVVIEVDPTHSLRVAVKGE